MEVSSPKGYYLIKGQLYLLKFLQTSSACSSESTEDRFSANFELSKISASVGVMGSILAKELFSGAAATATAAGTFSEKFSGNVSGKIGCTDSDLLSSLIGVLRKSPKPN